MTWTSRLADTQIHEIARDPSDPDVLWASTRNGVFKSLDNGASWMQQTNSGLPSGNLSRTELAIAPSDPDTVYVLYNTPSDEFWRTTDGGANWTMMNRDACDGQCSYNMVIRVDPTDPNVVYRGTVRIFKSVDGGANWTQLTDFWGPDQEVHQDTHSMLVHPTSAGVFYVGSDGGLWKSVDGGDSYTNLNGNLNVTQFYAIDADADNPDQICGGAQDNSSLATAGDVVWSKQAVTGDGFVCHFDSQDDDVAYVASYPSGGYPHVWRSDTGLFGDYNDITGPASGIIGFDRISWVTPYMPDPTFPSVLYLGTHRVYRSLNRGNNWTHVGPDDLSGDGASALRTLEVNRGFPSYVFSGSGGGAVWKSASSGEEWTDITTGLPDRSINDIAADPTNPDRAFAVVGGFNTAHLWEWNATGGWTERGNNDLPNVPANTVLMLSDTDVLVGMDTGVFRSVDGGLSFVPFMAGMPEGLVVMDLGELDGDGDGKIEPGETWSIRPIVRNVGGVTATEVTARLSTLTPGITILTTDPGNFGDLGPDDFAPVDTAFVFTVDPSIACGTQIVMDLVDLASTTPSGIYEDQTGFYTPLVEGNLGPPVTETLVDEDFDPPPNDWTHEAVSAGFPPCPLTYLGNQLRLALSAWKGFGGRGRYRDPERSDLRRADDRALARHR
jgi:hypothetical protein